MKVEVWFDFTCPYSYIGIQKLNMAIKKLHCESRVIIDYYSYQLSFPLWTNDRDKNCTPSTKRNKQRISDYVLSEISRQAADVGIEMNFDPSLYTNTLHAHRLVKFARTHGKETKVMQLLFHSYFCEQKRIDDKRTLLNIGLRAGLSQAELDALLCLNQFTKAVEDDQSFAHTLGISTIPFFVFNEEYAISGAQPTELFIDLLTESMERSKGYGDEKRGDTCSKTSYCEGNECGTIKKD